jgi:threonine dehydrogenase-like Zn-dependent dehydrogenase
MLALEIVGERRIEIVEVPDPQPKDDWVVVKVYAAPMCTEYKDFVAGNKHGQLGHEAVGEVVAVARPGRVKEGDRVIVQPQFPCGRCPLCLSGYYIHCQHGYDFVQVHGTLHGSGTMAQYLLKQDWLLSPIPSGVSYEHASLALCGLGPSFGAFQQIGLNAFDTVLITGAGPVGLGALVNARFRGAKAVVVESVPYRAEKARALGAAHVLSPSDQELVQTIRGLTNGGVDCAIDCAGSAQAERLCVDATRRRGRVAFVGGCDDELPIRVTQDMLQKGLHIIGNWHYNLGDTVSVLKVIQESPLLDLLVSHVLPMSEAQRAFGISASHDTAKVILKPWG